MIDQESYEKKKDELTYHKNRGMTFLIYNPDELLQMKVKSDREVLLSLLEAYYWEPLREIQEKICRIKSRSVHLDPPQRYTSV